MRLSTLLVALPIIGTGCLFGGELDGEFGFNVRDAYVVESSGSYWILMMSGGHDCRPRTEEAEQSSNGGGIPLDSLSDRERCDIMAPLVGPGTRSSASHLAATIVDFGTNETVIEYTSCPDRTPMSWEDDDAWVITELPGLVSVAQTSETTAEVFIDVVGMQGEVSALYCQF